MESKWQKVFVACALGAFIGGIVALQLNGYFWWVGLIAGGLVGYFTYEFKAVLKAVLEVWQHTKSWRPDFRPIPKIIKGVLFAVASVLSVGTTISVPLVAGFYLFGRSSPVYHNPAYVASILPEITFFGGMLVAMCALVLRKDIDQFLRTTGRRLWKFNILMVTFWYLPRYTFVGLWLFFRYGVLHIARFVWHVFKLIHSDERLLCGVDAAIGALVGYFTGNALIGAVFGGIFGVANFELVSKRLLHLVPAKHA